MRRAYRDVHQRVWWILGPALLVAVFYAAWFPARLPVADVAFGALQHDTHLGNALLLGGSVAWVGGLHVLAARRSRAADVPSPVAEGWLDARPRSSFVEGVPRAVLPPDGERIAVMLHEGQLYAIHAVCRHQGGPLDEGRIIDGCLTCPWHGWQYRPEDGKSPPPFTEELPIYPVEERNGRVYVDPRPGTTREADHG